MRNPNTYIKDQTYGEDSDELILTSSSELYQAIQSKKVYLNMPFARKDASSEGLNLSLTQADAKKLYTAVMDQDSGMVWARERVDGSVVLYYHFS